MSRPSDLAYPKAGEPDPRFNGLSKREFYAAMAMQGFLASPTTRAGALYSDIAWASVQMADALIEDLSK